MLIAWASVATSQVGRYSTTVAAPGPAPGGQRTYTLRCLYKARITSTDNKRFVTHGFCHCARPSLRFSGTRRFVIICFGSEGLTLQVGLTFHGKVGSGVALQPQLPPATPDLIYYFCSDLRLRAESAVADRRAGRHRVYHPCL